MHFAAEKASDIHAFLAGIMPYIGGPKVTNSTIIGTVVTSVMMYASLFGRSTHRKSDVPKHDPLYRLSGVWQMFGFSTLSREVAIVISGAMPIGMKLSASTNGVATTIALKKP